jgi:hypothetical protein
MHHPLPLLAIPLLLIQPAHTTTISTEPCPRQTLQIIANAYLSSQLSGSPSPTFTFSNTSYIQNNTPLSITSNTSILTTPFPIDHAKTTIDTEACATYIELISVSTEPTPGHGYSYVIGTQIHFDNELNAPTLIDSIVTTQGDWLFNATKSLEIVRGEDWSALPEPEYGGRVNRERLKGAVDAYLDFWGSAGVGGEAEGEGKGEVPWGTPCRRMEGGTYSGIGEADDRCDVGMGLGIPGGGQAR